MSTTPTTRRDKSPRQVAPVGGKSRDKSAGAAAGDSAGAAAGRAAVPPPRSRYRRRRWIALAVALLVVAAALAAGVRYVLVSSTLFVVEHVEVTGTAAVPLDAVVAAAAVKTGTPLLAVPVDDVTARVSALPGVASVEVSRDWPDTLRVQVTERVAVAITANRADPWLVDVTGLPYAHAGAPAPPLPTLAVPHAAPTDPATVAGLTVLAALPAAIRGELREVEVETPSMVVLRLSGDREVQWGSVHDLERKAAVLSALLSQKGSVYDVTSPDLPTIRR